MLRPINTGAAEQRVSTCLLGHVADLHRQCKSLVKSNHTGRASEIEKYKIPQCRYGKSIAYRDVKHESYKCHDRVVSQ